MNPGLEPDLTQIPVAQQVAVVQVLAWAAALERGWVRGLGQEVPTWVAVELVARPAACVYPSRQQQVQRPVWRAEQADPAAPRHAQPEPRR